MWFLFVILAAFAVLIYKSWYDSTSHVSLREVSELRADSRPYKVEQKAVGLKGERTYRTTVLFDDGMRYISHKSNRDEHLFTYTISVSRSLHAEILSDAVEAHKKAYAKQEMRRGG